MKKNLQSTQMKQIIEYKKSYPSKINKQFKKRQIDGAFISSVKSKKAQCENIGIVAKKKVYSVISLPGSYKKDYQSDTSNVLAQILDIDGEVIIGDKALTYYFKNPDADKIDLAEEWFKRYKLPFVFARLCFHRCDKDFKKMAENFTRNKVKIPQYILKKYSLRVGIKPKEILEYLDKISYVINTREKQSLKKFFTLEKKLKNKG